MKIFVSLKVPHADPELEQLAALTSDVIVQTGHEPFVAAHEIAARSLINPKKFMPFVELHLANSDLMIVLYHPDLRGGLIELGLAYAQGIPIWLCYKSGQRVSSSALGCTDLMIEYADLDSLHKQLFANLQMVSDHS